MKGTLFFILWFLIFSDALVGQQKQIIDNIQAFNKLYGYVKYFYPGDEAAGLDWDQFAIYGCMQVERCKDTNDLKSTLIKLFQPLVPPLRLFDTRENLQFDIKKIIPPDLEKYKVVAWQHLGVGLIGNSVYRSRRTNRSINNNAPDLFDKHANIGDYIKKDIGLALSCIIPLALYGDEESTYPKANLLSVDSLKKSMNSIGRNPLSGDNLHLRLGDLVILWNVMQHFFPYFDIAKTNWSMDFREAVAEAYIDTSDYQFQKTLQKFTAKLKDGHISVLNPGLDSGKILFLPIAWEWVEQKLIVTQALFDSLPIKRGEIISEINGQAPEFYFDSIKQYISAATIGFLNYKAGLRSLSGTANSVAYLKVIGKDGIERSIELHRNLSGKVYMEHLPPEPKSIRKLADSLYYINLDKASMDDIDSVMKDMEKSKAIICDLRGYPKHNHAFIQHLLTRQDTSAGWMRIPEIIYPDQENLFDYKYLGWNMSLVMPHLNAKIIFIIDGRAISYAESFMGFIENYKLATIVGQPTAGTNGNVNILSLPGNYTIYFTGMKVVKHNGTQHHGVGILPNIYVQKTIKGVRENCDEFLDKAIEIATRK